MFLRYTLFTLALTAIMPVQAEWENPFTTPPTAPRHTTPPDIRVEREEALRRRLFAPTHPAHNFCASHTKDHELTPVNAAAWYRRAIALKFLI